MRRPDAPAHVNLTERYFGCGYYQLYRHTLLPIEQTRSEIEFLLCELKPRPGDRWLDLPCGYGRHLAVLTEARPDLRLAGGDLNRAYLREPGLPQIAAVAACDMRRPPFATGVFHVVLNLLNSFGYYPPTRRRHKNRQSAGRKPQLLDDRTMLAEYARVLRPRGRLVLDLANRLALVRLVRRQPVIRYAGGDYDVMERFAWDPATEVLRNETVWRWSDGQEHARYRLRLYTPAQIRHLLERAGFEMTDVFGNFRRTPFNPAESDRMLVIARRK